MKNNKNKIVSRVFVIVIALCMMLPVSAVLIDRAMGEETTVAETGEFLVYGMVYNENMAPINGVAVMARNMFFGLRDGIQ